MSRCVLRSLRKHPFFSAQVSSFTQRVNFCDLCDLMKPSFDFRNIQHAKKVVSNNPAPLDFAIARVNSALNLPNGKLTFFE